DDQPEPEREHGERLAHAAAGGDPGNAGVIRQLLACGGRCRAILTPSSVLAMRAPAGFRSACADSPATFHPRAGLPARCERLRMAAMTTDNSTSLVLVVDDNPDATESLALILEIEGFRALTAHDGRSALARVEQERPDAVLLD